MTLTRFALVVLVLPLAGAAPAWAPTVETTPAEKVDVYTGVLVGTRGVVGGRTVSLTMRVREYTGDDKLRELAQLLAERGQDALQREMEDLRLGTIAPAGRLGSDIALARRRQTATGIRVLLVTARPMSFLELRAGGRSRDYPFSIVRFDLNAEGKGEGQVIGAAKVSFDKEGQLEVESLQQADLKLANVRMRD